MSDSFEDVSLEDFLVWYRDTLQHLTHDFIAYYKNQPGIWYVFRNGGTCTDEFITEHLAGFKIPYDPQDGCC